MKTYKIICRTDAHHASSDSSFEMIWDASRRCHSHGEKLLADGLTLKEAQARLLEFFEEDVDCHVANWGAAVTRKFSTAAWPETETVEAGRTRPDGTRYYTSDIYTYSIEEGRA